MYIVHIVSATCCSLKAVPLNTAPAVGRVGESMHSKHRDEVRSASLLRSGSGVNQWPQTLNDLTQYQVQDISLLKAPDKN